MNIGTLTFAYPWMLLLLLLLPLYLYLFYFKRNKETFKLGLPLVPLTTTLSWRTALFKIFPILQILALGLLIIAAARPQASFRKETINSEGIDIACALDLSSSMLAKDFEPNRLEASKKVIQRFVENRPGDRIGLIAFAGVSYTVCPPTLDHKVIIEFLKGLESGQIKDGTAIGMGISAAVNRLMDSEAESKIVILVTDGKNMMGAVDPEEAADMAAELGIKIYTIGVGTNGQALMPYRTFRGIQYQYAKVEIDEELLTSIANKTGGKYFRATNEEELNKIYDIIDKLEKSEFDSTVVSRREERFHPFVLIGFILLVGIFGLKWSIFRNLEIA